MFTPVPLTPSLTTFFASGWPTFIWNDSIMQKSWTKWFEYFPEFQCCQYCQNLATRNSEMRNSEIFRGLTPPGSPIVSVHAVPLRWDDDFENLPDGTNSTLSGWDWVIQKSFDDFRHGIQPNVLSAVAIVVAPEMQGQGLAGEAVKHLKTMAKEHGLKAVIAPLRPSKKRDYPNVSIDDYVAMRKPDTDLPFDPWLRLHVKLGARILKPCRNSVVIQDTLDKWTSWTNLSFEHSGTYTIPGGDEPLNVDIESNLGRYSANGVWVVHENL